MANLEGRIHFFQDGVIFFARMESYSRGLAERGQEEEEENEQH